jgi:hypothetical protein
MGVDAAELLLERGDELENRLPGDASPSVPTSYWRLRRNEEGRIFGLVGRQREDAAARGNTDVLLDLKSVVGARFTRAVQKDDERVFLVRVVAGGTGQTVRQLDVSSIEDVPLHAEVRVGGSLRVGDDWTEG